MQTKQEKPNREQAERPPVSSPQEIVDALAAWAIRKNAQKAAMGLPLVGLVKEAV